MNAYDQHMLASDWGWDLLRLRGSYLLDKASSPQSGSGRDWDWTIADDCAQGCSGAKIFSTPNPALNRSHTWCFRRYLWDYQIERRELLCTLIRVLWKWQSAFIELGMMISWVVTFKEKRRIFRRRLRICLWTKSSSRRMCCGACSPKRRPRKQNSLYSLCCKENYLSFVGCPVSSASDLWWGVWAWLKIKIPVIVVEGKSDTAPICSEFCQVDTYETRFAMKRRIGFTPALRGVCLYWSELQWRAYPSNDYGGSANCSSMLLSDEMKQLPSLRTKVGRSE